MKYTWTDDKKKQIKTTVTEERNETFSLGDLAQEWVNRKAALATAQADIVAFREKVAALRTDLALDKIDLVGMDDLDALQGAGK